MESLARSFDRASNVLGNLASFACEKRLDTELASMRPLSKREGECFVRIVEIFLRAPTVSFVFLSLLSRLSNGSLSITEVLMACS